VPDGIVTSLNCGFGGTGGAAGVAGTETELGAADPTGGAAGVAADGVGGAAATA
jgi:hypothetical protein